MEQFMNMLVVAMLSASPGGAARHPVQIDNWPALKITEHLVESMPSGCGTLGSGCAIVNFGERTCDIYVAWREPQKTLVRERQLNRCRGYDEPPFRLRTAYIQWMANQPCKPRRDGDNSPMVATAAD
jgi:hypothetical protein